MSIAWVESFLWGSLLIVRVFAVALVLTVAWGLLGAAAKLSKSWFLQRIAAAYTSIFRGTPELLVVLILYFGSAVTLTWLTKLVNPGVKFVDIPPFWAGALAISLIVGAYATETFRGALQGIDSGQTEAARALGLSSWQIFSYVKLPQMWRLALPGLGNHMSSIIKDTALLSVIGVEEIVYTADMATALTGKPFSMYMIVAGIYLSLTSLIVFAVARLETRANRYLVKSR
ncbi:MAG: ABC transporter permease subunit [Burkholderiaceae bacterium]